MNIFLAYDLAPYPPPPNDFLDNIDSIHCNIKFTTNTERYGHFPLLDIDICTRPNASLGHRIQEDHPHQHLFESMSHQHLINRYAVLSILAHSNMQIRCVLNMPQKVKPCRQEPSSEAFLPFSETTSEGCY
jgi:hypothetical protein